MNPSTMTPYVHDPRACRLSTVQRMVAQHARVVADFDHAPEYDSDDSDSDDEQDGYFTPDEDNAPPKVQKISPQRDRPYAVPLLQRQLNGRSSPAPSGSSSSPTSARSHMITNPCYGSSRTTFTMMAPRAAAASTTSFMSNSTKSSPSPTSSHFQFEPSRTSSQFAYVGRNGQVGKSHFHPAADAYMRNYDPQAHSNAARTQLAGRSQTPVPIPAQRLVQPRDRASSTSSGRTAAAGAVATLTRRVSTEFKQAAQGVRRRCSITSMKETGTRVQQLSKKVSGSLKDAAKKATDVLKHRPAKVVMVA